MASALQISRRGRRCCNSTNSKDTRRECKEGEMHFLFLFRSFSFDPFFHLRTDKKYRRRRRGGENLKKKGKDSKSGNTFMRDVK